jgi:iron complex outermembrane receptor protein
MKILLITIIIFLTLNLEGKDIKLKILAKDDNQTLIGASIYFTEIKVGSYTDTSGQALFKNLESKIYNIEISYTGFSDKTITLDLLNNNIIDTTIYLEIMESAAGDVLVEANRSYRTLSTTPTRVEILTDEIDEAASMESSKISHLITHSTGVQVQTTSASSNGSVVRIQGLKGRYTQLLKDGFPLYGGLSSSLDIMQIAPLDLKSVEFIKGSASTLYGGGAIGGLINLVSKTPTQDESLIHLNISHIGSKDINTFFAKKYNDFGVTALASVHSFTKYDPDNDGFSDIPETFKVNINPKLFYTTNENKFYLGFNYSKESRLGGDIDLIDGEIPNTLNYYYDKQNSTRFNTQLSLEHKLSNKSSIKLKNSVNILKDLFKLEQMILDISAILVEIKLTFLLN